MKANLTFFLGLLFISHVSWAANEPKKNPPIYMVDCAIRLKAVSMDDFLHAVRKNEVTGASLQNAEKKLKDYLVQLVHKAPASNISIIRSRLQEIVVAFGLAVSSTVKGQDGLAAISINKLSPLLGLEPNSVRIAVTAAAEDIDIERPFSLAEFISRNTTSIEALLLHLNYNSELSELEMLVSPELNQTTPFAVGSRQFEMVRRVLQFATSRPGERVLEIGYQFPGPALGIASYLGVNVTAVDLLIPPDNANAILANYRVELLTGAFPDSSALTDLLKKKIPFKIIYALDTIKRGGKVLVTNTPSKDYVKRLFDLTDKNGGTVIIINDYGEEPYFTREEAKAAGFEIVRWGKSYLIPDEYRTLMPYPSPLRPIDGLLATYVLRRGQDEKITKALEAAKQ